MGRLYDCLRDSGNAQIVGPRRIGKSSLLRAMERASVGWLRKAAVAWVDMMDSANHTSAGWFETVALAWKWKIVPVGDAAFSRQLREFTESGFQPVLVLDEFEKFTALSGEFRLPFFENLRAQTQLSILTASRVTLDRVREAGADISPYYNTFTLIRTGDFTPDEARAFVAKPRAGITPFTPAERDAILAFAAAHPLKLTIACDAMLRARRAKRSGESAIAAAQDEWDALKPRGHGEKSAE